MALTVSLALIGNPFIGPAQLPNLILVQLTFGNADDLRLIPSVSEW